MKQNYFKNVEDFRKLFKLEIKPKYEDYQPLPLTGYKVGFTVCRQYPNNIKYKPSKTKNGIKDNVARIKVKYPSGTLKSSDFTKIPILVFISCISNYRLNHRNYDYNDPNCPTKESVELNKTTAQPIGMVYKKDFFYDHESNTFLDNRGNDITGRQILNRVSMEHCDTTKFLKRLKCNLELNVNKILFSICTFQIRVCKYILKICFSRTIEPQDILSTFRGYSQEDLKLEKIKNPLNVFGYQASRNVVIMFCFLALLTYILVQTCNINIPFLKGLVTNNITSVVIAILVLVFLDKILPNILFWILNKLISLRTKIAEKGSEFNLPS